MIDKSELYQTFDNSLRRSERLTDLATRKALDLPLDEDMQIITNHTRQGLGRCGMALLSLAMLAGGGGAALGIVGWLINFQQPPPVVDSPLPTFEPQEFKVTFWDEDGENLEVTDNE